MLRLTSCVLLLALWGCASELPPPPRLPQAERYTPQPQPEQTAAAVGEQGGRAQRLVTGGEVPAQWWSLFRSPALDDLVRRALAASPTLAAASARLRQAQEEHEARAGATRYPAADLRLSANRIDFEPQAIGAGGLPLATPFNLYLASVGISYSFDAFGGKRSELQALQSRVDYQAYQLEAARLALAGNVVTAAIREASLREQIAATQEIVGLQQRQLAITERLEQIGGAAREDLALRRLELAQARAALPELQRQLAQLRHRLALYVGEPAATAQLPQLRLADLQLPAELPLSLPSALARQRPDLRAAEALLQQAAAQVGVATANLYPQLTLSANLGSLTGQASDLFGGGTGFYLLGAALAQPLFRGGELQARRRAAIAGYEQAGAAWRAVVLQAWQEVADVLRALEFDALRLAQRAEASGQARQALEIAAARHRAGGISQYALLDAERRLAVARLDQVRVVADRYADSAALLQALGGGWWHAAP